MNSSDWYSLVKGITVIGKEPSKEFVHRHQREVQASLTASYNPISAMANEMVPPFLKDTSESETLDLLHSRRPLWFYSGKVAKTSLVCDLHTDNRSKFL